MAENVNVQPTVVRTSRGLSIAGTRITLYSIMDHLIAGWANEQIRDIFDLTDAQIADVMQYIAEHRAEVEAEYQLVVRQAEEHRCYWDERNRERFAEIAAMPPKAEYAAIHAKIAENRAKRQRSR